jgi:hypothetical protein
LQCLPKPVGTWQLRRIILLLGVRGHGTTRRTAQGGNGSVARRLV